MFKYVIFELEKWNIALYSIEVDSRILLIEFLQKKKTYITNL